MPSSELIQCIYCSTEFPSESFNRDHVLPRAFGAFDNNFTLDCVCTACNNYFSKHLELRLARDTVEGLERFDHGVREPKDYKSLGRGGRMRILVDEGPFAGALAEFGPSEDGDGLGIPPIPQIGLRRTGEKAFVCYRPEDFPHRCEWSDIPKGTEIDLFFWGLPHEEVNRVLAEKGFAADVSQFQAMAGPEPGDRTRCDVVFQVDLTIRRAVAKVGFNYLAFRYGAALCRSHRFDAIRSFIRHGQGDGPDLVKLDQESILWDERGRDKRRLGHLITVESDFESGTIVAQVALFNNNRYRILLAVERFDVDPNICTGSFFNIESKQILPLAGREKSFVALNAQGLIVACS
jgi:hypothetical protein